MNEWIVQLRAMEYIEKPRESNLFRPQTNNSIQIGEDHQSVRDA